MIRQLALLLLALRRSASRWPGLFGAVSLGVALGVGQLSFAATLVWVLLRD